MSACYVILYNQPSLSLEHFPPPHRPLASSPLYGNLDYLTLPGITAKGRGRIMDAPELASLSVSPRLHQQLGQNRTAITDHDEEGMRMRGKTVRCKLTIEKRSYNLWFYLPHIVTVVDLVSLSMGTG